MEIELRKVETITPYPLNAKTHPKKQIEQVAASIKEFGFNQPLVLDRNGVIIVGHGRFEAAKLLKMETVPTVTVELSEEQAKAYRLADNRLNESEWNMGLVLPELQNLSLLMLELTGFSPELIHPGQSTFTLPAGSKGLFCQVTFILTEQQRDLLQQMLELAQEDGEAMAEEAEGSGNKNKNGNAISIIAKTYGGR